MPGAVGDGGGQPPTTPSEGSQVAEQVRGSCQSECFERAIIFMLAIFIAFIAAAAIAILIYVEAVRKQLAIAIAIAKICVAVVALKFW